MDSTGLDLESTRLQFIREHSTYLHHFTSLEVFIIRS